MEQLFAPWRIEWVTRDDADAVDGCPFCVLPERDADRESRIVARGERSFVLLNNYPYNPAHVMIIPDAHVGGWGALEEADWLDHSRMKARTFEAIRDAFAPDGFNAGLNLGGDAAGGSIDDHLHTHVVPRWNGDTNFMPVLGDTKVIVEALEVTYDRLHDAFAALEGAETADPDGAVTFPTD